MLGALRQIGRFKWCISISVMLELCLTQVGYSYGLKEVSAPQYPRSDRRLYPIEETLPGRQTSSKGVAKETAVFATHLAGYSLKASVPVAGASYLLYPGLSSDSRLNPPKTFHKLTREEAMNERFQVWSRFSFAEKMKSLSVFPPVVAASIAGATWGTYRYATGKFKIENLDKNFAAISETMRKKQLSRKKLYAVEDVRFQQVYRIFSNLLNEAKILYPSANEYHWDLAVVKDDQTVNAECYPGGLVNVYSGLLNVARNEPALAAVIGHELGHALAKHTAKRAQMSSITESGFNMIWWPIWIATILSGERDGDRIVTPVLDLIRLFFLNLPFSRKHETEADLIGLVLMSRAGYDPTEAGQFWERMAARGTQMNRYVSTHPGSLDRKKFLDNLLPQVEPIIERAPRYVDSSALIED